MLAAVRRSPYWPVLTQPVLRMLLPGFAVSYLGDGLALVAIVVLAQHLTTSASLVGLAVAASTLPGALGALALGRWLRRRPGAQLAGWDALLRTVVFSAIAVTAALGVLGIGGYVALLAVSSLLHSWGSAGRYTLLAEVLPEQHRLPGNAVLSAFSEIGTIAGPPLAGLIIAARNDPAAVIALDAATFAVLAVSYGLVQRRVRRLERGRPAATPDERPTSGSRAGAGGLRTLLDDRRLLGVLALSMVFFAAFGPVYVALPTKLADPTLLGVYYTAFGVGSLIGAAATGYLHPGARSRRSARPGPRLSTTLLAIVFGFGLAMLPVALNAPDAVAIPAFGVAGAIWAPYTATSMALLQARTVEHQRAGALAANSAVLVTAVPVGTALGGPAVDHLGAQATLAVSTFTIIALGLGLGLARLCAGRSGRRHHGARAPDGAP